jgi:hypothetical protein
VQLTSISQFTRVLAIQWQREFASVIVFKGRPIGTLGTTELEERLERLNVSSCCFIVSIDTLIDASS